MKKFLALLIVGVMTIGMTSMAAGSPSAGAVAAKAKKSAPVENTTSDVENAAANENLSVGEYLNNVIVSVPGLEGVVPMGIPQGTIINGVKTNFSVRVAKVSKADALSAAGLGKVLNVLGINNKPFGTVQISIYCKSIAAGQNISVFQKVNGQWVKLTSSVRAEHVDVVLAGNGPIAIIAN